MECEHGYLHAPNFADILIRDPRDWSLLPPGRAGVIETVSALPRSYPGHALLTEDIGTVHGIDDCPCGRMGTRFSIEGRVPRAELRGCSDTHAYGSTTERATGADVTGYLPRHLPEVALESLVGEGFFRQEPMPPFAAETTDFLAAVSKEILEIPGNMAYPELVSLAFWLRKANLSAYVQEFLRTVGAYELVLPRGTAFHVAPSNVDTIFLYSWALSLLAGNLNVVRLPQSIPVQLAMLLDAIRRVLEDPSWREIAARNVVLSYPREDEINRFLSARADVRMLWGGDQTVLHFRGLPAKPSTQDIVFDDKVSYAMVNAGRYLALSDDAVAANARLFFNDAYQFDQMACSSPRFVYFVGSPEECALASGRFWTALVAELARKSYDPGAAVAVDKLVFGYETAAAGGVGAFPYGSPSTLPGVMRISAQDVSAQRKSCGGGFFFECFLLQPTDLASLVQPKDQTLTYLGYSRDEMKMIGGQLSSKGIQRMVPFGQALAFTPQWDGYVLFNELTRRVTIG